MALCCGGFTLLFPADQQDHKTPQIACCYQISPESHSTMYCEEECYKLATNKYDFLGLSEPAALSAAASLLSPSECFLRH